MSPASKAREKILEKIQQIDDLPTLPAVAQQALDMSRDPDVSFSELSRLIHADPPLTATLLRLANSAYYGRRIPADTIDEALVTLGLEQVMAVCSSLGVFKAFDHWQMANVDRKDLWLHSLSTALLARSLQRRSPKLSQGPNLFLAGLLHHIGWIVFDHLIPEILSAALTTAKEIKEWSPEIERQLLGIDHAEAGAEFLRVWNMSDEICTIVANHHSPQNAEDKSVYADLIQISAQICTHSFPLDLPVEGDHSDIYKVYSPLDSSIDIRDAMRVRFPDNIKQAGAMADLMTSSF